MDLLCIHWRWRDWLHVIIAWGKHIRVVRNTTHLQEVVQTAACSNSQSAEQGPTIEGVFGTECPPALGSAKRTLHPTPRIDQCTVELALRTVLYWFRGIALHDLPGESESSIAHNVRAHITLNTIHKRPASKSSLTLHCAHSPPSPTEPGAPARMYRYRPFASTSASSRLLALPL
jgi:hypothetical protein